MARVPYLLVTLALANAVRPDDGAIWLLRGDACGEVAVRWSSTDSNFTNASLSEVPPTGATNFSILPQASYVATSETYTVNSVYSSPYIFSLYIAGLRPGGRYAINVWDDARDVYAFVAPECSLPRAEPIGSDTVKHTLYFVGDIGHSTNSATVLNAVRQELFMRGYTPPLQDADPGFPGRGAASLLLVGDVSYADGNPNVWDKFQVIR